MTKPTKLAHKQKRALITGISGQDGFYLSQLLISKGYQVYGMARPGEHLAAPTLADQIHIIYGDLMVSASIAQALSQAAPDEVYNLAGMSHVGQSFVNPAQSGQINGLGVVGLLEAIRNSQKPIRFYQASSSEIFGKALESPQTEQTPLAPTSPYGAAKAYAHVMTGIYRDSLGVFACGGILYNHESPLRPSTFVTRKITQGVARIKLGLQKEIVLGNLDVSRDWGFAGDYVEGMWLMLQQEKPDDYILATGVTHTIGDLLSEAFSAVGITNWKKYVKQDPEFMRPAEANHLIGNASKAKSKLGWQPQVSFKELIQMMVENDLRIEGEGVNKQA